MKQEIINCFTWYANQISTTTQYKSWDDKFCRKEVKESTDIFVNKLKDLIDLSNLTREEALELRFGKWEEDGDLYLIPLYLLPIIPIGKELTCINGEKIIYDGNNVDKDIRFGCIAYGINIPERKEGK